MKITQETDYALRIVLFLSKAGIDNCVEAKAISESERIPFRFALKILRKLTKAGVTKAYRGINGGYALNKIPENITLKDVVEAIDGPICVNRCLYDAAYCNLNRTNTCTVHKALDNVRETLLRELESVNFKNLMEKE